MPHGKYILEDAINNWVSVFEVCGEELYAMIWLALDHWKQLGAGINYWQHPVPLVDFLRSLTMQPALRYVLMMLAQLCTTRLSAQIEIRLSRET